MNKRLKTIAFFAVVASLALTGFGSGFMVALLHGLQKGDWGYMAVYVVVCSFGFAVLRPFVKQAWSLWDTGEPIPVKVESENQDG